MTSQTITTNSFVGVTLSAQDTTIASGIRVRHAGQNVVVGDASQAWTLANYGSVLATADKAVVFYGAGTVTNAASGVISNSSGYGIYIDGAGTVVNAGSIAGTGAAGIYLDSGGTVTNAVGGVVYASNYTAIQIRGAAGSVVNAGTIATSGSGYAVKLRYGGVVTNATTGTILANGLGASGVGFTGGAYASLTNFGTIDAGLFGVYVSPGFGTNGFVTNAESGLIVGRIGVSMYGGTVFNAGTIMGATGVSSGAGVVIVGGGSVTNAASGTIAGFYGVEVEFGGGGTVVNAGTIDGTGGVAVDFQDRGGTYALVVDPGAVFDGAIKGFALGDSIDFASLSSAGGISAGVDANNLLTLTSDGSLLAELQLSTSQSFAAYQFVTASDGNGGTDVTVELASGGTSQTITSSSSTGIDLLFQNTTIASQVVVQNSGSNVVVGLNTKTWTLANYGSVLAQGQDAVVFYGSGTVTNAASGVISNSNGVGVRIFGTGTVVNEGEISATVEINGAGTVVNTGTLATVEIDGAGTVANTGSISSGYGIKLLGGGYVSNSTSGVISASDFQAIKILGAPGTLVNAGTIAATGGIGVVTLGAGGVVTNAGTGIILGTNSLLGGDGIAITGGTYASVTNFGTIFGVIGGTGNGTGVYTAPTLGTNAFITNAASGLISNRIGISSGGTVFNAGTITGGNEAKPAGGTLTSGIGVYLDGPGVLTNAASGTISGYYGVKAGAASAPGGTVVNAGTIDGTGGVAVDFQDLGGRYALVVDPGAVFEGAIKGFEAGDRIDFASVSGAGGISAGVDADNLLTLTSNGSLVAELQLSTGQSFAGYRFDTSSDGNGGTNVMLEPLCFCAGTYIATPKGEELVERLSVGDLVVTAQGQVRPIVWIGAGKVMATRGRRGPATPVIVRKGALADNVPHRDLRLTKSHALYLDGALIPAEFLVNHRTILWDDRAQEVSLYHIELETHDVLLANGAAAESYRDDGNRWLFQNVNGGWNLPPKPPCAPVLTGGDFVDAAWRELLDRAGPRTGFPLTSEPDLHLLVNGERLDGEHPDPLLWRFVLHDLAAEVRLASRSAVPQELGVARDPRCLGVGIQRLILRHGAKFHVVEPGDERLMEGFHAYEPGVKMRWTLGDALLPAELLTGFPTPVELLVQLGCKTVYVDDGLAWRAA